MKPLPMLATQAAPCDAEDYLFEVKWDGSLNCGPNSGPTEKRKSSHHSLIGANTSPRSSQANSMVPGHMAMRFERLVRRAIFLTGIAEGF
jgi:hypothetical protein